MARPATPAIATEAAPAKRQPAASVAAWTWEVRATRPAPPAHPGNAAPARRPRPDPGHCAPAAPRTAASRRCRQPARPGRRADRAEPPAPVAPSAHPREKPHAAALLRPARATARPTPHDSARVAAAESRHCRASRHRAARSPAPHGHWARHSARHPAASPCRARHRESVWRTNAGCAQLADPAVRPALYQPASGQTPSCLAVSQDGPNMSGTGCA